MLLAVSCVNDVTSRVEVCNVVVNIPCTTDTLLKTQ